FLCTAEGKEENIYGLGTELGKCSHCWPPMLWDPEHVQKVLEHVAAHLLFEKSIDTLLELCSLCLRPAPSCVFYLRKGKGSGSSCQVDHQKSHCPNLQRFAYLSAAMETPSSLCTNVPVICPLCPSSSGAVWKYNLKVHFTKHHPSGDLAHHFSNFSISNSEQTGLSIKWDSRHKTC
ncbi:hypothetical protein L208DRAFT_1272347, partial [Tricholoma matsutake]